MENKVIENKIEVHYKVKVGEHYVTSYKLTGYEKDIIHDYSLGNRHRSSNINSYDVAKKVAELLKGSLIEITTTKIVLRNEKEVEINE